MEGGGKDAKELVWNLFLQNENESYMTHTVNVVIIGRSGGGDDS